MTLSDLKKLQADDQLLEFEHFKQVLDAAYEQVTHGKGKQRHGQDFEFSEQPWKYITDGVGTGFPIGQAIKKLIEVKQYHELKLNTEEGLQAWKKEALGAIVYIAMAIMWVENNSLKNKTKTEHTTLPQ